MSAESHTRRASLTVELLLLLPVLLAVLVAAVEFALLIAATQKLETAAALGARVAAQGGDPIAVEQAVRASLGDGHWKNARVTALLADRQGQPLPSGSNIEVRATITATDVVPDLLAFVGISLKDQTLQGRALLRKE